MVVVDRIRTTGDRLQGTIQAGRNAHEVYFQTDFEFSDSAADAFLLLALPAAMRRGETLVMYDPVSPQLLAAVPEIQALYHDWEPGLKIVEIRAQARDLPDTRTQPVLSHQAVSFTGGVDSFFSALQSQDASLLYVYGLDIPLTNSPLKDQVRNQLRWAAAEMGRTLIEVETNLRDFSDRYWSWQLAFGGALAACALLLSRHMDEFGIPAGQAFPILQPDGTHAELTPLFSTEQLKVRTVGYHSSRVEKVKSIASSPVVQNALRVCWENRGGTYNCGACEKCLRTMAALDIFGQLSNFTTFAVPLDYARLSRSVGVALDLDMFARENLEVARQYHANPELISSLEKALKLADNSTFRKVNKWIPRRFRDWRYRWLIQK